MSPGLGRGSFLSYLYQVRNTWSTAPTTTTSIRDTGSGHAGSTPAHTRYAFTLDIPVQCGLAAWWHIGIRCRIVGRFRLAIPFSALGHVHSWNRSLPLVFQLLHLFLIKCVFATRFLPLPLWSFCWHGAFA